MLDMHAHLPLLEKEAEAELNMRKKAGIRTFFSAGTPQEWKFLQQYTNRSEVLASFGIHPWYADQYELSQCGLFFQECHVIGEIGMDGIWCDVPLDIQQWQFEAQLQIASDLGKSVVLHTKCQEARIAEIVKDFPGKMLVHWYSGDRESLERFLNMDCYFTLGPDTAAICLGRGVMGDEEERRTREILLQEVPLNRIFLETDGRDAVAWARGVDEVPLEEIPKVLQENLNYTATIRGLSPEKLTGQIRKNLLEFC